MTARHIRIALVASLLANLFLVGGIVGAGVMWSRADHGRPGGGGGGMAFRRAGAALPDAQRAVFRRVMGDTMRDSAPLRATARAAREEASRLLAAPVLDRGALLAALARARAADTAVRARIETRLALFAATLPPADRQVMAASLAERGRKGRR